jgi:hypothetical protein
MKVILFLAAVYALIINQCHEKDNTAKNSKPLPVKYARSEARDTILQSSPDVQFAEYEYSENMPTPATLTRYRNVAKN